MQLVSLTSLEVQLKLLLEEELLQEGLDYTVNYQAGRVQILDESLKNSSVPIEISTESNSFYSQQKKRFSVVLMLNTSLMRILLSEERLMNLKRKIC